MDTLLIITSTSHGLFTFINIDDLEPPEEGLLANFLHFLAAVHISRVNCNKMAGDRPRQPGHEIFSIST